MEKFRSLRNLCFGQVTSFDVIRCGNNYGIGYGLSGPEAMAIQDGDKLVERGAPLSLSYWGAGLFHAMQKKNFRHYRINVDGESYEGDYITVIVANEPGFGLDFYPAIDARPDNGVLDIYMAKAVSRLTLLRIVGDYEHGRYYKWPNHIIHLQGKKITISSDHYIPACFDGEMFFDTTIEYEIIPRSLDFVYPPGMYPKAAP